MREEIPPPKDFAAEELRERFPAVVGELRPKMHRYCSRMCGSVLDGEDLVQETLAAAWHILPLLSEPRKLELWLFRMAHLRCLDFVRRDQAGRENHLRYGRQIGPEQLWTSAPIEAEIVPFVGALHPRERFVVILRDLLGFSLPQAMDIGRTVVLETKVSLHRGRAKLRELSRTWPQPQNDKAQLTRMRQYAAAFNQRDPVLLANVLRRGARVEIVGTARGVVEHLGPALLASYAVLPWEWRLSTARIDGELVLLHTGRAGTTWLPHAAVRLWWENNRVIRIRDYVNVDYLLRDARIEMIDENRVSRATRRTR